MNNKVHTQNNYKSLLGSINKFSTNHFNHNKFSLNLSNEIKRLIKINPKFDCYIPNKSSNKDIVKYSIVSEDLKATKIPHGLFKSIRLVGQFDFIPNNPMIGNELLLFWELEFLTSTDICQIEFGAVHFDNEAHIINVGQKDRV